MTRMSPPMINITNSLTRVSEQASFSRADMSQKKRGIMLSAQKDSLAMSRVCNMAWAVVSTQDHHQGETEVGAHDGGVVQRKTDGHIATIGHDNNEEALKNSKNQVTIHLGQAAGIGEGWDLALHVLQQFGHCGRGEAEVREGQVTEKQIHGRVEAGVQENEDDDEQVPQDGGNIHEQEQGIELVS